MQVFKMLWKTIFAKKNLILSYTVVFLIIFSIVANSFTPKEGSEQSYSDLQTYVAIKDHDESELSKQFVSYMKKNSEVKDIEVETQEQIKDALYYNSIAIYVEIPKGFQAAFLSDSPLSIQTQEKPDSSYNIISERMITTYLQNMKTYMKLNPERSIQEIDAQIQTMQESKDNVSFASGIGVDGTTVGMEMYFNYLFYIFSAMFILVGGTVLLRVYDQEIRKRNLLSPITQTSFNLQLGLGCISFALVYWLVFMVYLQFLIGGLFSEIGLYFMINSLSMVFVTMGITFLIANVFAGRKNNEEALNACANVLSLGSCFLCGVFLPQAMLGDAVVKISSFLPTYWYVKANEAIGAISMNGLDMTEFAKFIGIQCLFGLVFFLIAMFISKSKTSSKELA